MAITLPTCPLPKDEVSPELMEWGGKTSPAKGGLVQPVTRLGDRFKVAVSLPQMTHAQARAWIAAQLDSKTLGETVVWSWPQAEGEGASVGTPLVKGASQAGSSLLVDGLTPGITIKALTPFSFSQGGRKWLHMTRRAVTANGSGEATLPIAPMLRVSPADNLALNFTAPEIEGFFEGAATWTLQRLLYVGLSFTLYENA